MSNKRQATYHPNLGPQTRPVFMVTASGARVTILPDKCASSWCLIRDDGLLIFRSHRLADVEWYLTKYGDVFEPSPAEPTPVRVYWPLR